jgi:RIO-like serine/threonine protein kinase
VNAREKRTLLKRDAFGTICRVDAPEPGCAVIAVERDTGQARWWLRPLARSLARREARALRNLRGIAGVPQLLQWDGRRLRRSWIEGRPMQQARPADPAYFREALRLLRRLHAAGVLHNDLAKEPNWLVTADGRPALVDFQLAARPRLRGAVFRTLAYDDLRHLLKHKRSYCAPRLSERQRRILARRSIISGAWTRTGKPIYRFITRGLLGWSDREGAGDRGEA